MFIRNTGKLCFATLREGDGTELQAMLSLDRIGGEALDAWKRLVDLGDLVAVRGEVITSKRGELSVLADEWIMAAKSLRPLPVAHKPMSEEARVRQRYVDLIVRPQARETVRTRATVVRALRESCHRRGLYRGRDTDAAVVARRRLGPPIRHPQQRVRALTCFCESHRSCTSSVAWSVASNVSSRSTGTSETRGSTPRILPSSQCWKRTRRTATTTRSVRSPES